MKSLTVLFVLFSVVTISGSLSGSEGGNTAQDNSELDSFLDRYGFETANSQNEEGVLPLQLALELEDYRAAYMLIGAGANTDILYTLVENKAGLFECGISEEDVRELSKLYGEVEIVEVDLMTEGMSTPALELTFENETSSTLIFQLSEADLTICRMEIYSALFKTENGIGIGSTFDELGNYYDFDGVFWGDAGEPLVIVEEISMSFAVEQGDWWRMGEAVGDIPGNTKIVKIFTW